METAEKRISKTKVLILYSVAFYTIWTLFEFLGKPIIDEICPGEISSQIVKTVLIKNLVWVLPAALLVHHYIPTWTIHGELAGAFLHFGFVQIVILSIIFSVTFLKSRNILVPVALHMIFDFLVDMF